MRFKSKILIVFFAFAVLSPMLAQAMGETPKTQKASRMCDMSGKTQKFVLTSKNEKVKETFKVPVRYMSMELERWGKVNSTLHLAATWNTLKPSCQDNGWPVDMDKSLQLRLSINTRKPEEWSQAVQMSYVDNEKYQFEEIEIDGHPEFTFKASNRRPEAKATSSETYGYIPVYPRKEIGIPVFFQLECRLARDMKTLDICKASFLYQGNIAVRASFPSNKLEHLAEVYNSAIALIKEYHVK